MSALYYTDQRYNSEWEDQVLDLRDFETGTFVMPQDYLAVHHLPSTVGARTLPPDGPYATEADVLPADETLSVQEQKAKGLISPVTLGLGALAAILLFLPQ